MTTRNQFLDAGSFCLLAAAVLLILTLPSAQIEVAALLGASGIVAAGRVIGPWR